MLLRLLVLALNAMLSGRGWRSVRKMSIGDRILPLIELDDCHLDGDGE